MSVVYLYTIVKQPIWSRFEVNNADIICYIPTSLAYFQQGNAKKSKKLIKIVNTGEEDFHIFRMTWGVSMTFSGKMCLMMILKVTKTRALPPSLENTVLKNHRGEGAEIALN